MQRSLAEYLEYLAGIGFEDLYLAQQRRAGDPVSRRAGPRAPSPRAETPSTTPGAVSSSPALRQTVSPGVGDVIQSPDLETLAAEASGCTACRLCEKRNQVVFGSGDPNARLMLIGEGPGAEEDRQGLPFVGPAGELLTRILGAIELRRDQVYIANMVKCRPPNNRDPQPDEVEACRRYLERQIELVSPEVIVALGRVAAQNLLQSTDPLGRMRGRWHTVHGIRTRVTYHPAALLRNRQWKRPTWEDMQLVRDALRGG